MEGASMNTAKIILRAGTMSTFLISSSQEYGSFFLSESFVPTSPLRHTFYTFNLYSRAPQ